MQNAISLFTIISFSLIYPFKKIILGGLLKKFIKSIIKITINGFTLLMSKSKGAEIYKHRTVKMLRF